MSQKKYDPEAIREYRDMVKDQLDYIESQLIPRMKTGAELGKQPAFGTLEATQNVIPKYAEFHQVTWDNFQALRSSFTGIIQTLNDTLEQHGDLEEADKMDFNQYDEFL